MEIRKCTCCNQEKSLNEFYIVRRKGVVIGLTKWCKECSRIRSRKNYAANSEHALIQKKEYQSKPDVKEKIHLYQVEYRKSYLDKPGVRERKREREKNRMETDSNYCFVRKVRRSQNNFFRGKNINKPDSNIEMLGCSREEFVEYIESKFYPHPITGEIMNLNNRYKWHMDHIIPLNTINENSSEEYIRKLCHYTNIQPLWAGHNLFKNDRIMTDEEIEQLKKMPI